MTKTIPVSEFVDNAATLIAEVASGAAEFVVMSQGEPVAKLGVVPKAALSHDDLLEKTRRLAGAWSKDDEALDTFVEKMRQSRKIERRNTVVS